MTFKKCINSTEITKFLKFTPAVLILLVSAVSEVSAHGCGNDLTCLKELIVPTASKSSIKKKQDNNNNNTSINSKDDLQGNTPLVLPFP
ncbi:MAG TPA: hypothetical protein VJ729_02075 [Nitrososphaeraceae archaeon]|nr:hypothetical protein [Nitrososphaeraceae archaeon]